MTDRTVKYWDLEGADCLIYEDKDEAIEGILCSSGDMSGELEICGYAPEEVDWAYYEQYILGHLLERLDEEYGNPKRGGTCTEEMELATKQFIEEIKEHYEVWACEEVIRETIDIAEWVRKHRPDWLEEVKE